MTGPLIGAIGRAIAGGRGAMAARAAPVVAEEWGDAETDVGEYERVKRAMQAELRKLGQPMDLGNGNSLTLDPEAFRKQVLWSPQVIAQLVEAGQRAADAANAMAEIEGAVYGIIIQDKDADEWPCPRVMVVATNAEARVDEAQNSTITKAMMAAGPDVETSVVPDDGAHW